MQFLTMEPTTAICTTYLQVLERNVTNCSYGVDYHTVSCKEISKRAVIIYGRGGSATRGGAKI